MRTRLHYFVIVILVACLLGCSKKEEAAAPAPEQVPTAEPSANPGPGSQPARVATVPPVPTQQISQAIQSKQYDQAVENLTQIAPKVGQMTDQQRLQYQQAVRDATQALLAAQNDPAAKAAYEKLSRSMTKR